MTYNLFNGAIDSLNDAIAVIKSANPDILTINEANEFNKKNKKILGYFADQTNLPYYHIELCGDGDDYHVAVLSKFPFTSVTSIHPMSRAAILAIINTPLGEVAIIGTHLSPFDEGTRLSEIKLILDKLVPYNQSVIMGDLN